MVILFFAVSLLASIAGAICGIGGGVIIKPVLDTVGLASVSTISFLSGCTVLSMSCYSVFKSMSAKESLVDLKTGTPLAIGAAVGGVVGKQMFSYISALTQNDNVVGATQAACLLVLTIGTLVYTIKKDKIKTYNITNLAVCVIVGLFLGILSSFLGIGGGPINLVILYFLFSMPTKTAAQNSLYIILFSQITSLFVTLATNTVPQFEWEWLVCMVVGGIIGGIAGRILNKKMNDATVTKLFKGLMIIIILLCVWNVFRFTMLT